MKVLQLVLGALLFSSTNAYSTSLCEGQISVIIETQTGEWAEEMSWGLYNNYNELIGSFQGVENSNYTSYVDSFCVDSGCYFIKAEDSYGDGWNDGEILIHEQTLLQGEYETTLFSLEDDSSLGYVELSNYTNEECEYSILGCTNPDAINYNSFATIDDNSCLSVHEFSTSDNLLREYHFYKPLDLPAQAPLVFVLHGYSGSAVDMIDYTGFNDLADQFGFAVCYPQGTVDAEGNTFFNVGYQVNSNETVDDVLYIKELASFLQIDHNLSITNTFCTGMSNGGDMSYKLACKASETFSAFGSVAGTMINGQELDCNPSSLTSILEIHGTQDNVTEYEGEVVDNYWGPYLGIDAVISFWNDYNDTYEVDSYFLPNINTNDESEVYVEKYGSVTGTHVWLYKVIGGGHSWPGSWNSNMDIDASLEIWNFFQYCMDNPDLSTAENQIQKSAKKLYSVDVLGRKLHQETTGVVIDVFDDGTCNKRVVLK